MIPPGVEIYVALEPIDLRWGFDRLAGIAEERIGRKPRSGALFVFFGKRRTSLKVLFADATDLCKFYKCLNRGTFRLPEAAPGATTVALDDRALDDLLDEIDIEAAPKRRIAKPSRLHQSIDNRCRL